MLPLDKFPLAEDFETVVNLDIIPVDAKSSIGHFKSRRDEEEFLALAGAYVVCESLGLIKNGVLTPVSIASTKAERDKINDLLVEAKALESVDNLRSAAALGEAITLYNTAEYGDRKLAKLAEMDAVSEEAAGGRFNVGSSVEDELRRRESTRIVAEIGDKPVLQFLSGYTGTN